MGIYLRLAPGGLVLLLPVPRVIKDNPAQRRLVCRQSLAGMGTSPRYPLTSGSSRNRQTGVGE